MKRIKGLIFILLFATAALPVLSQNSYIKKYKPVADSLAEVFGIPASIIMAVAIVESGGGNSKVSRVLNNHFGITGKNNAPYKTRYKQYTSALHSYIDFCKLLARKKFYGGLKGNDNHHLWITAISKTGYSEIPEEWRRKISTTIQKYNL